MSIQLRVVVFKSSRIHHHGGLTEYIPEETRVLQVFENHTWRNVEIIDYNDLLPSEQLVVGQAL